jgi:hypothetical protein
MIIAIAVEHCRAEYAHADEPPPRLRVREAAGHQRGQRHDAAFAAIIGAHDQRDVLERHHDHQCPKNDGQDAEDVCLRERQPVLPAETLAQRV